MKKIVGLLIVFFVAFSATAQKSTKWIENRAASVSKEMQTVLSLTEEQRTKVYQEEVKKMLAIKEYKDQNGGQRPSNVEFKKIVRPFVSVQTEVVGGKNQMNKYLAYLKEKRANRK